MSVLGGRKYKYSKGSDKNLVRLSLADKKLTSKELARKLKDNTSVNLSVPTGKKRFLAKSV